MKHWFNWYYRFCHTVQKQHSHNEKMSNELSQALEQINRTMMEANKLREQLNRETNTLDERKFVRSIVCGMC